MDGRLPGMAQGADHLAHVAAVVAQRIVHDLAGVAGAVEGAIELAVADPLLATDALDVARESAAALTARLHLLRAAWRASGDPMDADGLRAIWPGLANAARVAARLDGLTGATPAHAVPMLLQAVLVAAESLPRGGAIAIWGNSVAGVAIRLEGRNAAWPAGFADLLANPVAARAGLLAAEPRTLTAALCAAVAHRDGVSATLADGHTLRLGWA